MDEDGKKYLNQVLFLQDTRLDGIGGKYIGTKKVQGYDSLRDQT